jgi:phosphoglycolate phosphatase-like HAD superfamily hydrolase
MHNIVLFDLDGTLANTMRQLIELGVYMMARGLGLTYPEAREAYWSTIGAPFATQLEEVAPGVKGNRQLVLEFEDKKTALIRVAGLHVRALDVLDALRREGAELFVVSSTREALVHEFTQRTGIAERVDEVTGNREGDDKGCQIASLMNHRLASQAVFVGDAPRDAVYARRVGVDFLGVEHTFPREEFLKRGLDSVPDLRAVAVRFLA